MFSKNDPNPCPNTTVSNVLQLHENKVIVIMITLFGVFPTPNASKTKTSSPKEQNLEEFRSQSV